MAGLGKSELHKTLSQRSKWTGYNRQANGVIRCYLWVELRLFFFYYKSVLAFSSLLGALYKGQVDPHLQDEPSLSQLCEDPHTDGGGCLNGDASLLTRLSYARWFLGIIV